MDGNNFNSLKSEGFVVSDLKSEICYIPSGYLKRQMGNARFIITRSTKSLENYRLACKVIVLGEDMSFEENKFIRMDVDEYGTKRWFLGGKLHRVDGTAVEWRDGDKFWFLGGKLHRVDGPAVERMNMYKEWWIEGNRHRVDGPAIEWVDGDKWWFIEDKLHRVGGPAIEYSNGDKVWFSKDKKHREDGPAVERVNGYKEWWINGKRFK